MPVAYVEMIMLHVEMAHVSVISSLPAKKHVVSTLPWTTV